LVEHLLRDIDAPRGGLCRAVVTEFNYDSGRTDVLALSGFGEVFAFEAKLRNWRKALHQAWRNTSHAQRAYVVMPACASGPARANLRKFEVLGVGLCVIDEVGGVTTLLDSNSFEPVIPWLHEKARLSLEECAAKSTGRRRRSAHLQGKALHA